ncbi:phosphoribosyl-ATP pyrophosphohydrolase [Alteribacillus sp. JSM 102045]|uniref:phosphoribosyl-ATP pyrophosphohydrolase n=1 Tax=Alteribacillus sp. JSM 102045 TaxID=1562101 RepID=UPI0035C207E6
MPAYNKLVRDYIPQIIEKDGKKCIIRTLNEKEFATELKKKLQEETAEYLQADNDQEALEELADVMEIIHSFAEVHGGNIEIVEKIRREKQESRGGFKDRIFLKEVE